VCVYLCVYVLMHDAQQSNSISCIIHITWCWYGTIRWSKKDLFNHLRSFV